MHTHQTYMICMHAVTCTVYYILKNLSCRHAEATHLSQTPTPPAGLAESFNIFLSLASCVQSRERSKGLLGLPWASEECSLYSHCSRISAEVGAAAQDKRSLRLAVLRILREAYAAWGFTQVDPTPSSGLLGHQHLHAHTTTWCPHN